MSVDPRTPKLVAMCCALIALLGCGTLPANLPDAAAVAPGAPSPVDGVWQSDIGGLRFRFEGGRAIAMQPYTNVLARVSEGQVVVRGLRQEGPRTFVGHAMVENAKWTAEILPDGRMKVTIATFPLPIQHHNAAVELVRPQWFEAQLVADAILPPPATPALAVEGLATGAEGGVALPASARARFGRYHALVIGNDGYTEFDVLETARNDARAVAELLEREYAFEVKLLIDATREDILLALAEYRKALGAQDNLLIYYAGHGWLDEAADEGYWLPVDARRDDVVNWVSNGAITGYFKSIEAKHILVVADSCYAGTLTRGIRTAARAPSDIQRMAERRARVVLTSGGVEPVADGGSRSGHSAFAAAFLEALEENAGVLDTSTLYGRIRRPVLLATEQDPDIADIRRAGHEGGDFLFIRATAAQQP